MMTSEKLEKANSGLGSVDLKGKAYVLVNSRVQAFRQVEPGGTISTEFILLDFDKGIACCTATIQDEEGRTLATGTAYEREGDGFVNKTSFVENCETSAVGRALGFLGIGIDDSIASAEEVANAMKQQDNLATDQECKNFADLCSSAGVTPEEILKAVGWKSGRMTKAQHAKAIKEVERRG